MVSVHCGALGGQAMTPRINRDRLLGRLETFNRHGAVPGGVHCRLAVADEDRAGRDLLVQWMRELGLAVTIDAIGNIVGVRGGREDVPPVMFGSHVDTVGTGGRYDGLYGVLAGLEACEAANDAGAATRRPLALVAFTNEEGARFQPYAMGSLVYAGGAWIERLGFNHFTVLRRSGNTPVATASLLARRRNSSKKSTKAVQLSSESFAGAFSVTGPSSKLKVPCNLPVSSCIAGSEWWVRAASRVVGFMSEAPRTSPCRRRARQARRSPIALAYGWQIQCEVVHTADIPFRPSSGVWRLRWCRRLLGVLVAQPLQTDQHGHADDCQQHSCDQDGIAAWGTENDCAQGQRDQRIGCNKRRDKDHRAAIQGLVERDHRRTVREPNPTEPQHTLATKSRGPVPAQQHDCGHNQAGGGIGEQYRAERARPMHQAQFYDRLA